MEQNFIRCTDTETINTLKALGFVLMEEKNGCAVFLNDNKRPQTFDKKKIAYTNILTMTSS